MVAFEPARDLEMPLKKNGLAERSEAVVPRSAAPRRDSPLKQVIDAPRSHFTPSLDQK